VFERLSSTQTSKKLYEQLEAEVTLKDQRQSKTKLSKKLISETASSEHLGSEIVMSMKHNGGKKKQKARSKKSSIVYQQ